MNVQTKVIQPLIVVLSLYSISFSAFCQVPNEVYRKALEMTKHAKEPPIEALKSTPPLKLIQPVQPQSESQNRKIEALKSRRPNYIKQQQQNSEMRKRLNINE